MKKTIVTLVLFVLSFAFCACATTGVLKNNAKTAKYDFAILFQMTPAELTSVVNAPSTLNTMTPEQKKVEVVAYGDPQGNLPSGISFNPKKGKLTLDYDSYLLYMEYTCDGGELATYVNDYKEVAKGNLSLNSKNDACNYKTMILVRFSGEAETYVCETKGTGLLKKAQWKRYDLEK
jgi:hypothetical protein